MAFFKEEGVINSVTLVFLVLSFTRRKLSLGQMWNYASYDNYSVKALETSMYRKSYAYSAVHLEEKILPFCIFEGLDLK